MTRDIAGAFNHRYPGTFTLPESIISDGTMTIPGIDGRKMSKSYNNYIDIFLPEKELRKKVMSIVTDAKTVEEPKNADSCIVYQIFSLVAGQNEDLEMRRNLEGGNYGYGTAKQVLFEKLMSNFASEREKFNHFFNDRTVVGNELKKGAEKARDISGPVLARVRKNLGFNLK